VQSISEEKLKVKALGMEHSIEILQTIYHNEWVTATEISKTNGITIATSVKYLTALYEAGLLDRRTKRTKTRNAYEYILKNPHIQINLDLSKSEKPDDIEDFDFQIIFLSYIIHKSNKMQGIQATKKMVEQIDLGQNQVSWILNNAPIDDQYKKEASKEIFNHDLKKSVLLLIEKLESELGQIGTKSIVASSIKDAHRLFNQGKKEGGQSLKWLPSKYHGVDE